ncbi:hypothetical protein G6F57_011289 [Rhizopus arrhizus]|uniref:BZIP domain-containing protein n=1 Tax=Rhizopus oryzae TaxID=64495 RepID=A0A9P6WYX6_RHIOR|nr:hypothetical protein G6F23_009756 [Rhizopus arrhizus]KAG1405238.1 hypothetical protein G6F58_010046 [Rhizopus delemar]KAG0766025.1 hypothetical protein G6F24_003936 [Rhizopus arrhizus]KAG0779125.1 hypothetical protein G6F22_010816 [Rhizopus arrhizus]KAG0793887.1 hypothetical protein G6F21_003278 [Rhizopus arrhizus]
MDNNSIRDEISPEEQFLDTQQLLDDPSMYNLIPSEQSSENNNNLMVGCGPATSTMEGLSYQQNVFEPFPSYTTQQYMPGSIHSNHRASLPIIYDTHSFLPNGSDDTPKEQESVTTQGRRYTEGSLPKYGTHKRQKAAGGRRKSTTSSTEPMDEQRRQFLERNRIAALKCRQRKKQWLTDLQHRVEFLATDNEQLQNQATLLREEVINLKTLLLAHKDCKVAQANGTTLNTIQSVSSLQHTTLLLPSTSTSTSSTSTTDTVNNAYTPSPKNALTGENLIQFSSNI